MRAFIARVVKLVDTRDLKSLAGNSVPVQVRPRAPSTFLFVALCFWLRRSLAKISRTKPGSTQLTGDGIQNARVPSKSAIKLHLR